MKFCKICLKFCRDDCPCFENHEGVDNMFTMEENKK